MLDVFGKQYLKQSANEWLYKEQLRKERKWKVIAYQLQPVCQQCKYMEARIIWIVQNRSQKAHGRAHQTDCGTDYGRLKQNRMRSSGVKHLTGKFEGAGTSHYAF